MALSNIAGWNEDKQTGTACGTACGASEQPAEKPAACGTAGRKTSSLRNGMWSIREVRKIRRRIAKLYICR